MKRILFTVSNDLNYDQRMHRICNTLHNEGYDVKIIGRRKRASEPIIPQRYRQQRLHLWFEKGKLFYIELNIRLFLALLFKKFDIVCGTDLDTILPCYFAAKLKSKQCVYDAHELFTEVPEVIDRPGVRSVWLRVEKFICKNVKYKYTTSQSVADEFNRRYGVNFEVIRNLPLRLHFPERKEAAENKLPVILYRGAVNKGRGLEAAIAAMKYIDAKLIIAGGGDIIDNLKGQAKESGLESKITFTGFQTPQQLHDLTLMATIGLNLLEADSKNYYFSLANKFLDYIQCRIPQVCMNFPEYKLINDEFNVAILIDEATPGKLDAAINKLLSDNKLKDELVLNCATASMELCWEVEEKKLIDFYKPL
jgi:glycosyltransferase involved in cell wall biosynthesis